ncbi:MAG: inositol transport system permease protein [Thermomicrobiales bacterium]|jgi:ribose/xylose/arabinose/galactoside ABC-type transport system permease subunit|nr:inositol transport system permease protein [Thermomicrobiales bacterium]
MAVETGSVTGGPALEQQGRRIDPIDVLGRFAPVLFLIVLAVVFSIQEPNFATERNFWFLLRQNFVYGILAVGMTFVILTGGIDLSVGSVVAFAGLVAAAVAKGSNWRDVGNPDSGGVAVLWAVLAAVGVGAGAGLIHGFAVAKLKVPAFVVTLGGLAAWRGAAQVLSEGSPINKFSGDYRYWGSQFISRVPVPVVLFAVFVIVGYLVLRYTTYGRSIYAVGGNPEAARLSGLNTTGLIMSVYVISGFCAGLCGFMLTSRLGAAEVTAGQGYELIVIAAVVIGGTSLFGGEGSVLGTLVGTLLIGTLNSGLAINNVNPYYQPIIIGLIVVLSVYLDQLAKRRRRG